MRFFGASETYDIIYEMIYKNTSKRELSKSSIQPIKLLKMFQRTKHIYVSHFSEDILIPEQGGMIVTPRPCN